jgi:hypothetical protein
MFVLTISPLQKEILNFLGLYCVFTLGGEIRSSLIIQSALSLI